MNRTLSNTPTIAVYLTPNEVVAVGAAVTHYTTWLARSPEHTKFQDVIKLLETFQRRLVQQCDTVPKSE
jgi:hypothetical protein